MKTNKSYKKRLKMTKKGKILARKPGQNHFNAKESRTDQLNKKRSQTIEISKKSADRFLANI